MRIAVLTRFAHRVGGVETYLESTLPLLARRGHAIHVWHEFPIADDGHLVVPAHVGRTEIDASADAEAIVRDVSAWHADVVFLHGIARTEIEARLPDAGSLVTFLHAYHGTCVSGTKMQAWPQPQPCSRVLGPACLALYFPKRCGGLNPLTMLSNYAQQRDRLAMLRRCQRVLTFSEHMRNECIAHAVDPARVVALPAFVPADVTACDARSPHRAASLGRPWHLAFVGRMAFEKGPRLLLEAIAGLESTLRRELRITVAGDGAERHVCEHLARGLRERGATVDFTGTLASTWRDQLLATVDLLVVPSLWPEPLGLIGLEAAASGVPAIAFDIGGIGEWLKDNLTGRLLKGPVLASTLGAGIADALSNRERLRTWGENARRLSLERSVWNHVEVLERALMGAAGREGQLTEQRHA